MDLISRVLIFFTFMIVHNEGKFSPMRTLTSFYTVVGIMIIFNVVLNERKNFCSIKYCLGELSIRINKSYYIEGKVRSGQVRGEEGRKGERRREEERGEERGGGEEVWLGAGVSGPLWGLGVLVYWGSFGALGS